MSKRGFLLILLAGGLLLALVPLPRAVLTLVLASPSSTLPVPVAGVSPGALSDTWGAPRSGGRRHQGIDIFARRNTPVTSPVGGVVLSVGRNRLGGHVVRILGPGLRVHYLAHLESFGPVRPFSRVREGEVVGFVGDSGNARGTPPHLHYGIYTPTRRAINPFPLLTRR